MDVSPELKKVIAGGAGMKPKPMPLAAAAPGTPGGSPVGAPMTTPQPNEGKQQAAMISVNMAMDMLEKALPAFGSESEEGKTVLKCLSGLSNQFGKKREETNSLVPAQLKHLMAQLPQAGGASPEMKVMAGGGGMPPPGAGAPPPGAGAAPPAPPMAA